MTLQRRQLPKILKRLSTNSAKPTALDSAKTLADYAVSTFTDAIDALDEAASILLDEEEAVAEAIAKHEEHGESLYAERVRTQKLAAKFRELVA
jgi:hypothetical protein